jgi:hypothetical protein
LQGDLDVRQSFDITAFHSYGSHTRRINGIKASLAAHGLSQKPLWDTELNNWGWDYPTAVAQLPGVYRELAAGGVARSFWYTSCTSDFGLGIFYRRDPEWEPLPFVRTPLFDAFKNQAVPYRLPTQPDPLEPGSVVRKPLPTFVWEAATPGAYPIVGYKLQLDRSLFMGVPLFARPELDIWMSTDRMSYIPLVLGGRSTVGTSGTTRTRTLVMYIPSAPLAWGTHYWRVAAVDAQGNVGPYSEPQLLQVRMPYGNYLPLPVP